MFAYYTLVLILLCLAGPFLLLSTKCRAGLWQKLGFIPTSFRQPKLPSVWFHAVSVGELNAVWPLIELFIQKYPHYSVYISTATATGQNLARQRAANSAYVFYFPLDVPWALTAWLDAVRPSLVVIVETEIWPGFIAKCSQRKIPILVVNGRISLRSFNFYNNLKMFFGPVVRSFSLIATQSPADAQRYRSIAGPDIPVVSIGNLKFDGPRPLPAKGRDKLREDLNLQSSQVVFLAGSTHEGEETACLAAFKHLLETGHNLEPRTIPRLILAPRHPERFARVRDLIESYGFRVRCYTREQDFRQDNDVFLLDTIGQLFAFYSLATIAFVGGTLAPIGGHNLLEPYAYGCPVICGPSLDKTIDVARGLIEQEALCMVANSEELKEKLVALTKAPQLYQNQGLRGKAWLEKSQGAVDRALVLIGSILESTCNRQQSLGNQAQITGEKKL